MKKENVSHQGKRLMSNHIGIEIRLQDCVEIAERGEFKPGSHGLNENSSHLPGINE